MRNHLFIVAELNPVQSRLLEEAVANAKGNAHDFQRIDAERKSARTGAKHNPTGIGMLNLDAPIRGTTAFRQLEENAQFSIQEWEGRLLKRAKSTNEADERNAAWIVGISLNVLADNQIADGWLYLTHPSTSDFRWQDRAAHFYLDAPGPSSHSH